MWGLFAGVLIVNSIAVSLLGPGVWLLKKSKTSSHHSPYPYYENIVVISAVHESGIWCSYSFKRSPSYDDVHTCSFARSQTCILRRDNKCVSYRYYCRSPSYKVAFKDPVESTPYMCDYQPLSAAQKARVGGIVLLVFGSFFGLGGIILLCKFVVEGYVKWKISASQPDQKKLLRSEV